MAYFTKILDDNFTVGINLSIETISFEIADFR